MTLTWRRYYLLGLLLVVISPMVGCTALMDKLKSNFSEPPAAAAEDSRFNDALAIYRTGDYQRALVLFSVLSNADTTSLQRQQARLGEICCRLMLADSPEDTTLAMGRWGNLNIGEDACTWQIEKTLFDPLVIRWTDSLEKPLPAISEPSPSAPSPAPDQKQMETELTELKEKAAQVSKLQRRLDDAMAENRTLKQKIKALEAIDQNIQKKKTEMSTPNE